MTASLSSVEKMRILSSFLDFDDLEIVNFFHFQKKPANFNFLSSQRTDPSAGRSFIVFTEK